MRKKKDVEIRLFGGLYPHILKGTFVSIFREQLGSIILSACLGFVASLAIIWVIHNPDNFKISFAIPN